MATVRDGSKAAMVVVDVQVGVMKAAWEAQRVVANISRAVGRARSDGVPVVWVQHANQELVRGSAAWQWVPELVPAHGETLIHKQFNSAFEQTDLDAELARLGVSHIVLAGAATNWCIRATAHGALDRGYDLALVKDAHTTEPIPPGDGVAIEAETPVRELDVAIQWLDYPGLVNRAVGTGELDFAQAAGRT